MFSNLEQFSIARFGEARLASQFSLARTFLHSGYFHCYCYCLAIQPRPHISLFSQKVTMGGMAGLVSQADEQVGHNWYERWIMWLVFLVFLNCSYWKPPYSRTTCNAFPSTALSWPQEIAQSIISGISDGKYKYKVIENTSSFINTRSMITQNVSVWTLRELSFKFCRQFPGTKSTLRFVCICVQKSLVEDLAISSVVSDLKHKD